MKRLTDEQLNDLVRDASGETDMIPHNGHIKRAVAELRELRTLLATPMPENRSVYWYDDGERGPRIGFTFHGEDHITDRNGALQIGAALVRAVLAVDATKEQKP